jgi:hypothetical protein
LLYYPAYCLIYALDPPHLLLIADSNSDLSVSQVFSYLGNWLFIRFQTMKHCYNVTGPWPTNSLGMPACQPALQQSAATLILVAHSPLTVSFLASTVKPVVSGNALNQK